MRRPAETTILAAPLPAVMAAGASPAALSPEERQRLHDFLRPADRQRSLAAHWLKRQALARMTKEAPTALRFRTDDRGKPHLCAEPGGLGIGFNISHAGDWVALAVSRGGAVGVDVEQSRPEALWNEVLPAISAPGDEALAGLWLWTAKEAVLKQRGSGFLGDPQGVGIRARHAAGFVADLPEGRLRGAWRAADAGHLLAVASELPCRWRICRDGAMLRQALAALV